MRDARHSTGPGYQGQQTDGGVRTAAPPLVVETANRACLREFYPNQAPEGPVRGPPGAGLAAGAFHTPQG